MTLTLPIDAVMPEVIDALRSQGRVVLQAPPGAGKTTRVPLAMLDANLTTGRILMLEQRRLAARAAAERMAQTIGEPVGETVGYRIRGTSKVSKQTRIEVVTEGILTRMLQDQPDLPNIGAVIFDEFHERSLNADLGLALCLEVASALRDDLLLVAMSATLDAAPIAKVMDAPIVTSQGRAYDVTPHWLTKPIAKTTRFEQAVADTTLHALSETTGSVLVFLPGEGEIRRVHGLLEGQVKGDCTLTPLFGAMDFAAQREAISPAKHGRKIVLATAIAETSLTIPDIKVVVDGGKSRRARFDPASGMSRLVTERVTRAEATQRAGRAGRVQAGDCYKVWTRGEDGALAAYPPAEIDAGDLTGFALELAVWGSGPEALQFVTPPHAGRLAEAQAVLKMLGALDFEGRITPHGRALASYPLHHRLAHMIETAGKDAAQVAALLAERDPLRGVSVDLNLRIQAMRDPNRFGGAVNRGGLERIKVETKRLAKRAPAYKRAFSLGEHAALAYPDRIGLRRAGEAPRFVLSGGKGAIMPPEDAIGGNRLIVATDLDGDPREARIRQAVPLADSELRNLFEDQIEWRNVCLWSRREGRVLTRRQECFGALVLEDHTWSDAPDDEIAVAMMEGIRQLGLKPSKSAKRFIARCKLMDDSSFPSVDETHLLETLEDWLLPHISGVRSTSDWKAFDIIQALQARLDWDQTQALNRVVPGKFETPLGRTIPIDYSGTQPQIAIRLQELFGVTEHPMISKEPLQITLLSPAQKPVQITADLPRFWETSYADVRKDMRGSYPRHPWPEDPTKEDPTLRAKRRK